MASEAPSLECRDLHKSFPGPDGTSAPVIGGLSFKVKPGEFVSVLGPSGAGKTTLLRCITGLDRVDSGEVLLGGAVTHGVAAETAVVFQDYSKSLFPWLNLERNVMFGLKCASKREARDRARTALGRVGLDGYEDHYPWQISGGMQQRTAIARALAREASMVVFDEPFAAIDALTRIQQEDGLLDLWAEFGFTALFVTHDVDEAVYLSDRLVVLGPRPTYVAREVVIDLPRPRDQVATRSLPAFSEYRAIALETLGVAH
jgi:NitT/TauT family transport system ATP-binding protein